MGKIVWHEFVGSWAIFVLLCLTIIGIPVAVLYLIEHIVTVEEKMEKPSEFLENFRTGSSGKAKVRYLNDSGQVWIYTQGEADHGQIIPARIH